MRFKLGDTVFYVESSTRHQKRIPCPMCFGKKYVQIILGDDSKESIECGYCAHGFERPSGTAITWEPEAVVYKGEISGISTRDSVRYEIGYRTLSGSDIFETEEAANMERDRRFKEETERAALWFRDSFITAKKTQIWSAGYHRRCIKDLERSIGWHKLRLGMIEDKK